MNASQNTEPKTHSVFITETDEETETEAVTCLGPHGWSVVSQARFAMGRQYSLEPLGHRWQTQGLRAESGPPPCFIQPDTLFLPSGSAELLAPN